MGNFTLKQSDIKQNIQAIKDFMAKENLDAFYVSSYDAFLNEYVPMNDCHRFYVTGFTGSVAEALFLKDQRVKLYVDGRYHEQADLEVDANEVEVVKVPQNMSLEAALLADIKSHAPKHIGIESQRTSLKIYKEISELSSVNSYQDELSSIINFQNATSYNPIKHLERKHRGSETSEKLQRIGLEKSEAYYVTAIDSVSWISNCRGYHLPHLSSILSKALVCQDKVYLFKDDSIDLDDSVKSNSAIEFFSVNDLASKLAEVANHYNLEKVHIQSSMLNASDYQILVSVLGENKLNINEQGLIPWQSIKEQEELDIIIDSFNRSNRAVFNTIQWVKQKLEDKVTISERDIYNATSKMYQQEGALEQSFNTISGAGANGSIIHYGDPKESRKITANDMILLDSGGYYEAGFATDKTRTFMASKQAGTAKHKEIYTLVLKGTLGLQNAIFPKGTTGAHIDALARTPMYRYGYDYAHGTGHGVGIHVHEPGVRISSKSTAPMQAGQVVSIEPGIYIPGFGGVRLENIAYVEEHPEFDGFLRFKNLVYIGFEPLLIDESLLNEQEKIWLEEYEKECAARGTSFR
jgi:Xaa-Pro aminopeptidase